MCGIVGIVSREASTFIETCTARLGHRGPDGQGIFIDETVALGHTRLAILDLTANGNQPMQTADGRYTIVFNGEIYNHIQLRETFVKRHVFRSTSDTETLLYGFATYGTAVFNKLNGIFACAIFDAQTRQLTLARDPFGVKPLYYYHRPGNFVFASESKAIINFPGIDKTIDYKALVNYLHFLYSPGAQTPFQAIHKLLPGHFMQLSVDALEHPRPERYYDIPFTGVYAHATERQLLDELDEHLREAVKRQLQSDVPLGFFLSGGLDSSLITAIARRVRPDERLTGYTIRTASDQSYDGFANDLPYARRVAAYLGADLVEVAAEVDIVRDFDRIVYSLDEPLADPAPINVLNICRQARQNGHTVLLGGAGGDDLFSGYRRHQALAMEPVLSKIPRSVGRLLQRTLGAGYSQQPLIRRLRKLTAGLGHSQTERIADYFAWLPLEMNRQLFQPDIQQLLRDYQPRQQLVTALDRIPDEPDLLNQVLFWELNYFLPDHNLNYTDKMSMAVGVEARVPFLDKELVQFSAQLPPALKMRGTTTKYLLRKVAERYLPHDVIYRPKTGFGTPLRDWLRKGQLAGLLTSYLSEESLRRREVFDPLAVQRLVRNNEAGKIDASYTIWSLMAIESWFRQFVD